MKISKFVYSSTFLEAGPTERGIRLDLILLGYHYSNLRSHTLSGAEIAKNHTNSSDFVNCSSHFDKLSVYKILIF